MGELAKKLFAKPLSFGWAISLSLCLHIMGCLLAVTFLTLFDVLSLDEQPLVFDFVYLPTETSHIAVVSGANSVAVDSPSESAHSASAAGSKPEAEPIASKESPNNQNDSVRASDGPELETIRRRTAEDIAATPVVPPNYPSAKAEDSASLKRATADILAAAHRDDPVVSTVSPQDLVVPLTALPAPTPSAKLLMDEDVREMFRDRFRKWTEDFHKMELVDSTLVWEHKNKRYVARFSERPARSNTDIDEVQVTIETEDDGVAVKTEMRMKRLAFSNFAQFVDHWDPWVAIHDDELVGRFHANSKINIAGDRGVKPKFHGKVTTASYDVNATGRYPFFDDKAVFLGGLETGVRAIKLPRKVASVFTEDNTVAENHVQAFSGNTWIVFNPDGTYSWKSITEKMHSGHRTIPDEPYYIIGDEKKQLHIKGIVRGKVLVYSPGKIVIDGDLTYAHHPEMNYVADDYLGVVSDRDIEIAEPGVTGPGDLNIHASIYARRRFKVGDLYGNGSATMHIYGSLTAGTLSATEPRYATKIHFDRRLEQTRPPSFPMTNRYEVSDWDEMWEVGGSRE